MSGSLAKRSTLKSAGVWMYFIDSCGVSGS